ncbi:MAG: D-proline reductase (dithiol) proprotein PrdA [Firmicutes bacterium]|nr:D-proline reductase (dithiol) proprotein PrdA [Bacillota bacterium]
MSITAETAKQHANDPAVLCCRAEEGTVLDPSNFEDPAIFPDLVDSGLLNLDGALTLGQVLNGKTKLTKTVDSLTAITPAIAEGFDAAEAAAEEVVEEVAEAAPAAPVAAVAAAPAAAGTIKLHIGEGKNIDIEIPAGLGGGAVAVPVAEAAAPAVAGAAAAPAAEVGEEKVVRELTRKHYNITEVKRGPETKIEGTTLYIREGIEEEAVASQDLVTSMKIEIITPELYHTYSETVMDIQPIATKEDEWALGEGYTRVLDGVVTVVTGTTDEGIQIAEFGSSEGYLDENMMWGRPGAVDKGETMIKYFVTIKNGKNMERPGPIAAHSAVDYVTAEIRNAMKKDLPETADSEQVLQQVRRPGKKKVVIVKEIMGQGAMHDNFLFPSEPVGVLGARPNVDLGNVPVCASPLEVMDGCIHALTCIGPASKEMSRHYWREPLVLEAIHDPEVDLVGVVFVGSPQANSEKFYVSNRVGQTVEMLDVDGAFVTTEGFGNNHVDFVTHIENIGKRGIPVVGFSFCAVQGALVVGNKYCDAMVDNNKSNSGIENEVLACNTLCTEDAIRGLALLKAKMAGEPIKAAERKYNVNVKNNNIELIEKAIGSSIELVDNEQALPMSEKRKAKYD